MKHLTTSPTTQLIPILITTIDGQPVNSVDARTLWENLESKQRFADWITAKVLDSKFFMENQDYVLLHEDMKQNRRGFSEIYEKPWWPSSQRLRPDHRHCQKSRHGRADRRREPGA